MDASIDQLKRENRDLKILIGEMAIISKFFPGLPGRKPGDDSRPEKEKSLVSPDSDSWQRRDDQKDLKENPADTYQNRLKTADTNSFSLKEAKHTLEMKMITRALEFTNGNRTHAARLLEISHPSLLSKIKEYDIDL